MSCHCHHHHHHPALLSGHPATPLPAPGKPLRASGCCKAGSGAGRVRGAGRVPPQTPQQSVGVGNAEGGLSCTVPHPRSLSLAQHLLQRGRLQSRCARAGTGRDVCPAPPPPFIRHIERDPAALGPAAGALVKFSRFVLPRTPRGGCAQHVHGPRPVSLPARPRVTPGLRRATAALHRDGTSASLASIPADPGQLLHGKLVSKGPNGSAPCTRDFRGCQGRSCSRTTRWGGDNHPSAPATAGHQQSLPTRQCPEVRAGLGLHQKELGAGAKLCPLRSGAWEQACIVPRSPHGRPVPAKVHERVLEHPLPAAHRRAKELGGMRAPARDAHHPSQHIFKCLATK